MTDRPTAPTDRPGLRPAAPERASVDGHRLADPEPTAPVAAAPTDHTPAATQPTNRTADRTDRPRRWGRTKQANTTDPAVLARASAIHRPTAPRPTDRPAPAEIAPVPHKLKWLGVWLDRTFGTMPLLAPLVVSGFFTMQVFTDQPIGANGVIAFFATCALEGGVWKLSRLYEKTLVAGDSTIALRLGIALYLVLISGLIYWHADHQTQAGSQQELGYDALPAFGVAVMSALGVFIWSRTARWQRRRELHAAGRVDVQAPKFAALAWILCPLETPQALRHAVRFRIESPVDAVESLRLYKSAGKPAVWPPVDRTVQPTDPTPLQSTRPAVGAPAAVKPTGRPVDPTPAAPTVTARPTAPAQPVTDRPATRTDRATDSADRPEFTPAAVRNAALIRSRYGTRTDLRLPTVRGDLGWSFDRADPALKAYHARADQPTDQEDATDARPLAHAR